MPRPRSFMVVHLLPLATASFSAISPSVSSSRGPIPDLLRRGVGQGQSNSIIYCAGASFQPPCLLQLIPNNALDTCFPIPAPYGYTSLLPFGWSSSSGTGGTSNPLAVTVYADTSCTRKIAEHVSSQGVADFHSLPGNSGLDTRGGDSAAAGKGGVEFAVRASGQPTPTTKTTTRQPSVSTVVETVPASSGYWVSTIWVSATPVVDGGSTKWVENTRTGTGPGGRGEDRC